MIEIDLTKCTGCSYCKLVCPKGAIDTNNGAARVLKEKCDLCEICLGYCPVEAIHRPDLLKR